MTCALNRLSRPAVFNTLQRAFLSTRAKYFIAEEKGNEEIYGKNKPGTKSLFLFLPYEKLVFSRFVDKREWIHETKPSHGFLLMMSLRETFSYESHIGKQSFKLIHQTDSPISDERLKKLIEVAAQNINHALDREKLNREISKNQKEINKICAHMEIDADIPEVD